VKLLALDTSTQQASVALGNDGAVVERSRLVTTHSETLLMMVDEVFTEAGVAPAALDAIACGAGPGSFTGLRIGLATVKGLCYALGKPLVLVSSLEALAARAPDGRVLATLDAYKGEVYAGVYTLKNGVPTLAGDERVVPPSTLSHAVDFVVGGGAQKYPAIVAATGGRLLDEEAGPRARDLLRLAERAVAIRAFSDLSAAAPKYIRPSEAELFKDKKRQ
jgi:tRNA threonylcarbamoyladenosine biosynthesis protein TsaB